MRTRLLTALVAPALFVGLAAPAWAEAGKGHPFVGILAEPPAEKADKPGVVVHDVAPDSPAARAGLKAGDVIFKADGKEVKNFDALAEHVKNHKPGDKLTLHVRRDGKEQTLTVTVGEDKQARRLPPLPRESTAERRGAFLGVHTQELTKDLKDRLGLSADKGALVTDVLPDSPAAKAGLKQDDVITGVNDKAVSGPKDLRDAIHKMDAGKEVTVKAMRGKEKVELKAKLQEAPAGQTAMWREFPDMERWMERVPREVPFAFARPADSRVQELEKRVQELEKTVRDLQEKLAKSGK